MKAKTISLFFSSILALMLLFNNAYAGGTYNPKKIVEVSKAKLEQLSGVYKDPKTYEYGKGVYGQRTFSFNNGTWTLHFILSLDPEQKMKVFEYRCIGTYKLLAKSSAV